MGKIASGAELAKLLGLPEITVTERRRPFQEYNYADLTSAPKKAYLVGDDDRPVLLEGALWQTMGLLKSGKTFYCMEIAFCVAFGLEFHGLKTKEGNVAYVIAEGGIGRNFERVRALCEKYESQLKAKFECGEDFVEVAMNSGKFNLIDDAIDLAAMEPAKGFGPDVFLAELKQKNYVLVVLDTWARMLWASGGHDSDQNTVGPAIQGCDRIRKALGCTVVMVAHIGVSKDAQGRAKGLSDPAGAIDGATHCRKVGDGPLATYVFRATFQRFAVDGFEIAAQLKPTGSGSSAVLMSDNLVGVVKLSKRESQMLEILKGMEPGASLDDWHKAVRASNIVTGRDGKPAKPDTVRKAFDRVRDALVKADAIEINDEMVTVSTRPSGNDIDWRTAEEELADEGE
jgi:AAA domain